MTSNVTVQQNQDQEGNEKEDGDDEDEVKLGPRIVDLGQADGRGLVRRVLDHGQDGCCESKGKEPGNDAGQTGLALGPHQPGLEGGQGRQVRTLTHTVYTWYPPARADRWRSSAPL